MELVNKVLQGYVDGELKDIAPSTRQDNVFLSTNQEKTIEDGLISVYTHTRSGTVNEFTGTGPNGKALLTQDIEQGDTFTVNGISVTAYMGDQPADSSMAGGQWNGKWVTFVTQDGVISFSGGGSISQNEVLFSTSKTISQQQTSESVQSPTLVLAEGSFTKQNEETALRISASAILKGNNFVFGLAAYIDDNIYYITCSNIQEFFYHSGSLVVSGVSAGVHRFRFVVYGSGNAGGTMTVTAASYQIANVDCIEIQSAQQQ